MAIGRADERGFCSRICTIEEHPTAGQCPMIGPDGWSYLAAGLCRGNDHCVRNIPSAGRSR